MDSESFKTEMRAILNDITYRLNLIDNQMETVEDKVQNDLENLAKLELIRLDAQQLEDFKFRHKDRLKQLRMEPLKSAKKSLQQLYAEIKSTLGGLNGHGSSQAA